MNKTDIQYQNLLRNILVNGIRIEDERTGVGTLSIFGGQMRFNLSEGFPLITTKKLHTKSIFIELLWFLLGETNNNWLVERGVHIWDEWAAEDGQLGPIYGKQWRAWDTPDGQVIDQLFDLLKEIRTKPSSRRQIVTAWNPADNPKMALTPCHCLWQTRVANGKLDLLLYQRKQYCAF